MSGRYVFVLAFLILSSFCLAHEPILNCPTDSVCSGSTVTVTCWNISVDNMAWQILDRNGMTVESFSVEDFTNSSSWGSVSAGGVDFYFIQNSNYSASVNFTAAPSIDDYWFVCSESNSSESANCTIDVITVQRPQDFMFQFRTISNTSIFANWTSGDDSCVLGYQVNITAGNALVSRNYTTNNFFTIETLVDQRLAEYGITVAPIGLDGVNVSRSSGPWYITFDTPLAVSNIRVSYMPMITRDTPDMTPINVTIRWNVVQSSRPRTNTYYITHNATRHLQNDSSSGSGSGSGMSDDDSDDTPTQFVTRVLRGMGTMMPPNMFRLSRGARAGDTYSVTIFGRNALGNGTSASTTFTLTFQPQPTPTPSRPIPTATASVEVSMSSSPTDSSALPTWAIAMIAVGVGVFLAVVVAAVVVLICCCFCVASAARKQEEHEMTEGTKL